MSASLVGDKRRWAAAAGGAIVIVVVGLLLLRIVTEHSSITIPTPARATRPPVVIERPSASAKILNEETVLQDPMPLFLPTEHNVTFRPPPRPEAGRTMLDFDDKRYTFGDQELKLGLPPAQAVAEHPVEVVQADHAVTPLFGFGRADVTIAPFPARGGRVEILEGGTNERVLVQTLPVDAKPPSDLPWRPLEFRARVDAAGLVGPLLTTQRSDVEEVDRFFQDYLVQRFHLADRLAPGFYRILVGP